MPEGTNEAATGTGGEKPKEGAVTTPPEVKAKADPPAPPEKKPDAKPEPKEAKGGDEGKKPEPKLLGKDDDIPEDAELVQMSKAALSKRLARHTKKELRERFGTDDPDKIKSELEELKTLREERESKRRADMSEIERAKEDAAKEKKKREEAEAELQRERDTQIFTGFTRDAETALKDVIAPKHLKRAMREMKEHIVGMDDDDPDLKPGKPLEKFFAKWAKDFVKENPEFAKEAPDEPRKIALTTGSNPNVRKEKGDPSLTTKTPTPGKVNSMSRGEYAAYKRERGLG